MDIHSWPASIFLGISLNSPARCLNWWVLANLPVIVVHSGDGRFSHPGENRNIPSHLKFWKPILRAALSLWTNANITIRLSTQECLIRFLYSNIYIKLKYFFLHIDIDIVRAWKGFNLMDGLD